MPDRFPPHTHFQTTKSRSITLRLIIQIGAEDRNRTGTNLTIRGILSPLRLPVPPPRQVYMNVIDCNMEAAPRIELGIKVLQTSALPLGYGANQFLERVTRLELATSTLARWRSTR